jgi:hypothetical protein
MFLLPPEIFDQIFADIPYADRWCFALSCKDAARYATSAAEFLAVPVTTRSPICTRPQPKARMRGTLKPKKPVSLSKSKVYRDFMQSLSKGWVAKDLHWCDQCRRFKSFPAQSRDEWYGGRQRQVTVEAMRKSGGWVQDISLSSEGLICWSHSCPGCAQRWWKSLPEKVRKSG